MQSLTNQCTGDFQGPNSIKDRSGEVNVMRSVLNLHETPPATEQSFKAATKLRRELPTDIEMETVPLMKLSSLTEDFHDKTREVAQNTDLNMRDLLGIDKALQTIQGELKNNTSTLTEISNDIKNESKKLKRVEDDPAYSEEQRKLSKDKLEDLNTVRQARFEILSQNWKALRTQVARVKQSVEKILDQNKSWLERACTLFHE